MNNEMIPEELSLSLSKGHVIPFVGAGVSMSIGLPSYSALIHEIGSQLGFDGDIYEGLADYLTLAEYYKIKSGSLSGLKESLKERLSRPRSDIVKSPVYEAIVSLGCRLIYTTNFDRLLEEAHRGFNVRYRTIRSARDMVGLQDDRVHIVKYHGDFSDLRSLVFDESSYFKRLSFEDPLDIKLRHDILGKSILFIGYSLSDINIRYLLYRLQKQWESQTRPELRPKSYVFLGKPNEVLSRTLESRGVKTIIANGVDQSKGLTSFLIELKKESERLTQRNTQNGQA